MKVIIPIIGAVAVIVQIIRFWPLHPSTLLSAFVTGAVFYITSQLGWDMQKNRILQDGYKGWGNWCIRAFIGATVFLSFSLALLFYSFHNPICEETGDPFFGRCEKHSTEPTGVKTDGSFNTAGKAYYPLLLALAFVTGSATKRMDYIKRRNGLGNNV